MPSKIPRLKGFGFLLEIIAYAVWVYHRFALSTSDVEDLLSERCVTVIQWSGHCLRHFPEVERQIITLSQPAE